MTFEQVTLWYLFSKILIPIDFSERCLGAARFAYHWQSALILRLPCFT